MSYKKDSIIYLIYVGLLIYILVGAPYFFLDRFIKEGRKRDKSERDFFTKFLSYYNIISLLSVFLKLKFVVILTSILIIFFFI